MVGNIVVMFLDHIANVLKKVGVCSQKNTRAHRERSMNESGEAKHI